MTTYPAPTSIAWNVARACSRGLEGPCAHCLAHSGGWPSLGGELSTMELLHVAEQFAQWTRPPVIELSGGDPLGREDLETLVAKLARCGVTVGVATPGGRLTRRRVESLAAAGVTTLAISVASSDHVVHDALGHPGATLDDALVAAARWSATGRELVLATLVSPPLLAGDAELRQIARRARDLGASRLEVVFPPAGARGVLRELAPAEADDASRALADIAATVPLRVIGQPQSLRALGAPARCECGRASCRITPEGKLTACVFLDDVFGDVRRAALLDSWRESPALARLREGERAGKCSWCEHAEACGGCRARAATTQHDVLAADLSCSHEPAARGRVELRSTPTQEAFEFSGAPASPPKRPRS